ncbi:hypothetical protein D3C85_1559320 [compost metagenome]
MPIKIKAPIRFANEGDMKEDIRTPICIEVKIMIPDQSDIIPIEMRGIRILRNPYITPTPKPSRETANAKISRDMTGSIQTLLSVLPQ